MAQVSSIADEQTSTPISSAQSITLRISRFNPEVDESSGFMEFSVPVEKWTTVLEAILEVKKHFDHSVAVRYSCRQATCGSCGMIINGKPRLACFTKISELNSNIVTVEPMNNFPVIRDLAVKFEQLFDTHQKIKPYLIRDDTELVSDEKEFLQSPEEVEQYIQFANCIKCGLCNSACPTMATDSSFVGPQALASRTVVHFSTGTENSINPLDSSTSGLNLEILSVIDCADDMGVDVCSSAILETCAIPIPSPC